MISSQRPLVEEEVLQFLHREVPWAGQISLTSRVEEDLRMVWEDIEAMLVRFFDEFKVEHSGLRFDRYFPQSRTLWAQLTKRQARVPLTVGMLVDAAERGAWPAT